MRLVKTILTPVLLLAAAEGPAAQLQASNAQEWMQGYTLPDQAESDDILGNALATGDFDGDGRLDLAIGVRSEDVFAKTGAGIVHVVYGGESGLDATRAQTLRQGSAGLLDTSETGDTFGHCLASGDFDGDGADDLAIGVPYEELSASTNAGAVHVVYGVLGVGLGTRDHLLYEGQFSGTDVSQTNDRFGRSLAVGDFDGNGLDDLAVGAPLESVAGFSGAGLVIVYRSLGSLGLAFPSCRVLTQDMIAYGQIETGDSFGTALASGDFDGDGEDDLALATPYQDQAGVLNSGIVQVVYGAPGGLDPKLYQVFTQRDFGEVDESNDWFGLALAAGDFNGNQVDDLVIGVPYEDVGSITWAGMVHTLYGYAASGLDPGGSLTQDTGTMQDSAEANDRFGYSFAAGDFTGEGYVDLAIGVPGESLRSGVDEGAVSVVHGSLFGLHTSGNQFWHQESSGITSYPEIGDQFGYSLAAGDFDSSRVADLAIGVATEDGGTGQTDCGIVHSLYGQ
jgi:hypothetical protein